MESKNQRSLWRMMAWLKRRFAGDVIAAEVGEGAQDIVVGKNIIQIGNLVIPTLPVLVLVLLTAAAFIYLVFLPRGPKEMSGEFNIAVAQFGELDSMGNVQSTDNGKNLSRWLFERLQAEYTSLTPEINAQIWHDSVELGTEIGIIPGSTPEERSKAAADLAEKIKADVIVYGNIQADEDGTHFIPEFYVPELLEAKEIVGHHELGTPILLQLPIDRLGTRLQFNQKLGSRTKALTFFTIGLAWEFSGQPEKALELFQQAAKVEDWKDSEGKEVVYLFIGREAFFLWQDGRDLADEVRAAFQHAKELNPDYARANIGLGNFYYQKADIALTQAEPNLQEVMEDVESAINEYQQALNSEIDISSSSIEVKSRLALGGAYRLKGEIYMRLGESELADNYIELAIAEAETALEISDDQQIREQAQAYLGLGLANHLRAENLLYQGKKLESLYFYQKAFDEYSLCTQHIAIHEKDWFLEDLDTNYCKPYRQDVEEKMADL